MTPVLVKNTHLTAIHNFSAVSDFMSRLHGVHAAGRLRFHDSKALYPHLRLLTTITNPSALLAVSMLPFIGIRMPERPPFSLLPVPPPPLPGVPITHRASNSHSSIPGLQRHIGRWARGFMACWWTVEGCGAGAGRWYGPLQRGGRVCCCSLLRSLARTHMHSSLILWQLERSLSGLHSLTHSYFSFDFIFFGTYVTRYRWRCASLKFPSFTLTEWQTQLLQTWFSLSFFMISKVTLQEIASKPYFIAPA